LRSWPVFQQVLWRRRYAFLQRKKPSKKPDLAKWGGNVPLLFLGWELDVESLTILDHEV
jgi:hypothetical protein